MFQEPQEDSCVKRGRKTVKLSGDVYLKVIRRRARSKACVSYLSFPQDCNLHEDRGRIWLVHLRISSPWSHMKTFHVHLVKEAKQHIPSILSTALKGFTRCSACISASLCPWSNLFFIFFSKLLLSLLPYLF